MWYFSALIISFGYSANLLSFLIEPLKGIPIRTLCELSEAVESGKHQTFSSKIIIPFLLNSKEEHLQQLGKAIVRNHWYTEPTKINSYRYINTHTSLAIYRSLANLYFGTQDNVYISEDIFGDIPLAFAYSKHFCCINELNQIISRLSTSGLYDKFMEDDATRLSRKLHGKYSYSTFPSPVSIDDLFGTLMLMLPTPFLPMPPDTSSRELSVRSR
ncbi:glutamate receptor ionotropic, delta-1 [Nephila pilipes]|uniref:Glutamate receptor ionotropic, delta-1 n=1 Tax=Nephila pilipes TaxID=299642 RepID=A0A8X6TB38_NEPPI|nr:glutamate receptor ionotropic, delta-1 [Nephila pilipes]